MPIVASQELRLQGKQSQLHDLSVIVVSYNTCNVLRRCLHHLRECAEGLSLEIIVVDNGSRDGSVEMLQEEYPEALVIPSDVNLGFAAANNRALRLARGRYFVLLNSDAFLRPGALRRAIDHMESEPEVGLGGGQLISQENSWQPSARAFPSLLNDFLILTGLASRFPHSRFFGRPDRTWADPMEAAEVDWVPGAFSIIRPEVLAQTGFFDEAFFLYCEEVDLCRRIKALDHKVRYWPDVVIVHLGGESAKSVRQAARSHFGSQLMLWSIRSRFLYYRKHHGAAAHFVRIVELCWHRLRLVRNCSSRHEERRRKAAESRSVIQLLGRAWTETRGGRISPTRPW
jgi:GT2 family glycosyltransferase